MAESTGTLTITEWSPDDKEKHKPIKWEIVEGRDFIKITPSSDGWTCEVEAIGKGSAEVKAVSSFYGEGKGPSSSSLITVGGGGGVVRVVPDNIVIQLRSRAEASSHGGYYYDGPLGIEGVYLGDTNISNNMKYIFNWDRMRFQNDEPNGDYLGFWFLDDTWNPNLRIHGSNLRAGELFLWLEVTNRGDDYGSFGPYRCRIPITLMPFGTETLVAG